MENKELIDIENLCIHYSIEVSFMQSLSRAGLVEVVRLSGTDYIRCSDLAYIEKLTRLHHDLDINIEGLAAVVHLLEKVDTLQREINRLRNRLSFYEN